MKRSLRTVSALAGWRWPQPCCRSPGRRPTPRRTMRATGRSRTSSRPGPRSGSTRSRYSAVTVDTGRAVRADGTRRRSARPSSTTSRCPTPAGGTERFAVQRTQLMEASSPRHTPRSRPGPASRSTTRARRGPGRHADGLPRLGARAQRPGRWYVDPAYNKRGTTQHLAYYGQQPAEELRLPGRARAPAAEAGDRPAAEGVARRRRARR